jgi:hypothetical protein
MRASCLPPNLRCDALKLIMKAEYKLLGLPGALPSFPHFQYHFLDVCCCAVFESVLEWNGKGLAAELWTPRLR